MNTKTCLIGGKLKILTSDRTLCYLYMICQDRKMLSQDEQLYIIIIFYIDTLIIDCYGPSGSRIRYW